MSTRLRSVRTSRKLCAWSRIARASTARIMGRRSSRRIQGRWRQYRDGGRGAVVGHVKMDWWRAVSLSADAAVVDRAAARRRLQRLGPGRAQHGPQRSRLGPTACRRRFVTRMAAKRPCKRIACRCDGAHSIVRYARRPFLGNDGQRLDFGGHPHDGYPFPDTEVSIYRAREASSRSFRADAIASSPTSRRAAETTLAIRRLKRFGD